VELAALIGYYAMVALTWNVREVGMNEGRKLPPRPA
jgi:hypothetical protein